MKSACTAGNGQSTLVVKAKGKTVMNKFPKLVAIKKDNSNATELALEVTLSGRRWTREPRLCFTASRIRLPI